MNDRIKGLTEYPREHQSVVGIGQNPGWQYSAGEPDKKIIQDLPQLCHKAFVKTPGKGGTFVFSVWRYEGERPSCRNLFSTMSPQN